MTALIVIGLAVAIGVGGRLLLEDQAQMPVGYDRHLSKPNRLHGWFWFATRPGLIVATGFAVTKLGARRAAARAARRHRLRFVDGLESGGYIETRHRLSADDVVAIRRAFNGPDRSTPGRPATFPPETRKGFTDGTH